ncbi:four helix bundle protein [Sunxiuqinia sp. A32]|uniref:four helix bundle protein n=1 Tax=Sunxiuqinia sp. A32 TaxID=3461496 RepID=UPI0040456C27
MKNDLANRLFQFSVKTIEFLRTLPVNPENKVIRYQLTKSATSSGANYEEAQAGSSKADFIYKLEIALKEMRESNYWLRIINSIHKVNQVNKEDLRFLVGESEELMKILGSIVKRTKDNLVTN